VLARYELGVRCTRMLRAMRERNARRRMYNDVHRYIDCRFALWKTSMTSAFKYRRLATGGWYTP
jgi:hypothetical protein